MRPSVEVLVRASVPTRPVLVVEGRVVATLVRAEAVAVLGRVVAPATVVPTRPATVGRELTPAVCEPVREVAPMRPLGVALLLLIEPVVLLPP